MVIRRVVVYCRFLVKSYAFFMQLALHVSLLSFVWTPCWQLPCNSQLEGPAFIVCKCLRAPFKVTVWNTSWNCVIMTAPSCTAAISWYSIITTIPSRLLGNVTKAWKPNYLRLSLFSKYKKAKSQYFSLYIDYFRGKWASNLNMRKIQFPNIIPITLSYRLRRGFKKSRTYVFQVHLKAMNP